MIPFLPRQHAPCIPQSRQEVRHMWGNKFVSHVWNRPALCIVRNEWHCCLHPTLEAVPGIGPHSQGKSLKECGDWDKLRMAVSVVPCAIEQQTCQRWTHGNTLGCFDHASKSSAMVSAYSLPFNTVQNFDKGIWVTNPSAAIDYSNLSPSWISGWFVWNQWTFCPNP